MSQSGLRVGTATMTRVPLEAGPAGVVVDVTPDHDELGRRRECGSRPILDLDLLNLLLKLPLGRPVPTDGLSGYEQRKLNSAQRVGAVSLTTVERQRCATRWVGPALKAHHVTVTATRWLHGLSVASRFAPYASRDLILDQLPTDDLGLRLQADYMGIGVCVADGGPSAPLRRVVEPAPFAPARYTGASWLFTERLLPQVVDGAGC